MRSIAELVKTYKLVNDANAPSWNVKFLGVVVAGALLLIAAGSFLVADESDRVAKNQFTTSSRSQPGGAMEDYIGYKPETFNAALGFDATRLDAALASWERDHPGAVILAKTPTWAGSHLIGYTIRYHS